MFCNDLLTLNDIDFLKEIVRRCFEVGYLAGEAEMSPEGNQLLKEDALAWKVFGTDYVVDPTAVEADRTFLGLLTLKWVLTDRYEDFTSVQQGPAKLTRASFQALQAYTQSVLANEEDLEFCFYSLACNDLGKTLFLAEDYKQIFGRSAEDHDQLLYALVKEKPELFPAFVKRMTDEQKKKYLAGLGANLNLGQFAQGENLPFNLKGMQALDAKSRELRLVCELYDFAGATGHINANGSLLMTEDNYFAYHNAIKELTTEPLDDSYRQYISTRAALAGFYPASPEFYVLGRLAAMARIFSPDQGFMLQHAWRELSNEERSILSDELSETGTRGRKGILLYYAPAAIVHAIKTQGDFQAGLRHAFSTFARIYKTTRETATDQEGEGVITVNIAHLARDNKQEK